MIPTRLRVTPKGSGGWNPSVMTKVDPLIDVKPMLPID